MVAGGGEVANQRVNRVKSDDGQRTRTKFAANTDKVRINAVMRIVHWKPTLSKSCCTNIGNIVPPMLDPIASTLKAWQRFVRTEVVSASHYSSSEGAQTYTSGRRLQDRCRKAPQQRTGAESVISKWSGERSLTPVAAPWHNINCV